MMSWMGMGMVAGVVAVVVVGQAAVARLVSR